jgi:hypothetical protein
MAATWLRAISRAFGFEASRIDLVSPLARDDCVHRLRGLTGSFWIIFGSRPLIGRVDEISFSVRMRMKNNNMNSFQTSLYGVFEQESRQTRLRCRFGLHPTVVALIIFWIGGLSLIGAAVVVNAIVHSSSGSAPSLIALAGPFLMVGFAVALVKFGRYVARDEASDMLDILAKSLNTRVVPGSAIGWSETMG